MKTIFRIARTELRTLFFSPIAWFLLIAYFVQCAAYYMASLKSYAGLQEIGGDQLSSLNFLTDRLFGNQFGLLSEAMQKLYLYIPLLTMGLLSRETGSGTIKLLYSSPVKVRQIVLGKYLAMLLISLVMVALVSVFLVSGLFHVKDVDRGMLLSGALGLYLLICTYSAIGLFMSSLTTYQIVAAVCTFIMIGILSYIGTVWQSFDFVRDITYFLSLRGRTEHLLDGLIITRDVLYFLVITAMFIGITIVRLKTGRESKPFLVTAGRYMVVIVSGLLIGYISSRPALTGYYDLTAQQRQTLTPNAQSLVREIKTAPLEVTAYNNLLGKHVFLGVPGNRNQYLSYWNLYLRFDPDIKFNVIQYYDEPLEFTDMSFASMYPGKTLKEVAGQAAETYTIKLSDCKTPEEMRKLIDLRPELNGFVMLLKWKDRWTILRTFDDGGVFPGETEVSAAFKRLLQTHLPRIAFLTGDLERNISKIGAREYKNLTHAPTSRYSLMNQGFDTDTLNLDSQDIPAALTALVVADPKTSLSALALSKLRQYIGKGGNLLIAGEPGKQTILNPLLQQLGVRLMDGSIAQPSEDLSPDLVQPLVTPAGLALTRPLEKMAEEDTVKVSMAGAAGLSYKDTAGFTITPLLMTDARKAWVKKDKLVLDSADILFDAAAGDERIPVPTAIGLSREIGGRQQRIVVTGDADFMSNADLVRNDVVNANFPFSTALFSWLSNGEFPIDTYRPDSIDNRVSISLERIGLLYFIYVWIVPGILVASGATLLVRRKRK